MAFALQAVDVETRIGERLAAMPRRRRMSQANLAAALGVSGSPIRRLGTAELTGRCHAWSSCVGSVVPGRRSARAARRQCRSAMCRLTRGAVRPDVHAQDRHVTETEMTQAPAAALLHATDGG